MLQRNAGTHTTIAVVLGVRLVLCVHTSPSARLPLVVGYTTAFPGIPQLPETLAGDSLLAITVMRHHPMRHSLGFATSHVCKLQSQGVTACSSLQGSYVRQCVHGA